MNEDDGIYTTPDNIDVNCNYYKYQLYDRRIKLTFFTNTNRASLYRLIYSEFKNETICLLKTTLESENARLAQLPPSANIKIIQKNIQLNLDILTFLAEDAQNTSNPQQLILLRDVIAFLLKHGMLVFSKKAVLNKIVENELIIKVRENKFMTCERGEYV